MGDFGAKGSVKGFDVKTVTDYLQLFNSSWPHLKIEHGGVATINLSATPQTIYTHNLGYPPFFIIMIDGKFDAKPTGIGVDSTILGYDGSYGVGGTLTFYYYVCRLSLADNLTTADVSGSVATTDTNDDYGLKVMKPGKDITSTDLRDYALYSSSRSLMVHKVDYGVSALNAGYYTRTVAHGLSYIPLGFCFVKLGTNSIGANPTYHYSVAPSVGVAVSDYNIDATNMNMRTDSFYVSGAPNFSSVILKDPFSKETIARTYP
ncbi:MAG: hypothetical protein ABIR46_03145 [Candidatus Saccharimonadales bacterium]